MSDCKITLGLMYSGPSTNHDLYSRHQNLALKLKALKSIQVTGLTNPDSFIKAHDDEQISTANFDTVQAVAIFKGLS